ncbi:YdcF family protein [Mycobacterium antarcticum]|uniref:YdcF family protein n=1 Tax=Mycolicibacterium sp. TUM20984 TaxID=3023368 RepID=UPI0024E0D7AD|nr:YdcF family protein [Mycolicibacterium sp. TUM20984]
MRPSRRILAVLEAVVLIVVIVLVDVGVSGYYVFANAKVDPLQRADAIIVLGGEHDGREDYGLHLAREGWAPTVVLSDPYWDGDPVMRRVCRAGGDVEVMCLRPDPLTTRGEAAMMRSLAAGRSWQKIIVVSWRYHLPRARLVFRQCFSGRPDAVIMTDVPRRYRYSLLGWEFVFTYQWAGLAKAVVQGECP